MSWLSITIAFLNFVTSYSKCRGVYYKVHCFFFPEVKREKQSKSAGKKTVTFAEEVTKSPSSASASYASDLSLYRAYCAIRLFMLALATKTQTADQDIPLSKVTHQNAKESQNGDLSESQTTTEDESVRGSEAGRGVGIAQPQSQSQYQCLVVKRIQEAKDHISSVNPLSYRLEILENVFSLLFVTYDDVVDIATDPDESSEEGEIGDRPSQEAPASPGMVSLNPEDEELHLMSIQPERIPEADPGIKSRLSKSLFPSAQSRDEDSIAKSKGLSKSGTGQKEAGNDVQSASSHTSSSSNHKIGFLADEYLTRDILLTLKECLAELANRKSDMESGKSLPDQRSNAEKLAADVRCDISGSQFASRLGRLTQYVSEALWKFQITCGDWVPREFASLSPGGAESVEDVTDDKPWCKCYGY